MKNADMPAMPVTEEDYNAAGDYVLMQRGGLTKREYFAAMAMQGLCCREGYGSMEDVAHDALAVANALLAELDKEAT